MANTENTLADLDHIIAQAHAAAVAALAKAEQDLATITLLGLTSPSLSFIMMM